MKRKMFHLIAFMLSVILCLGSFASAEGTEQTSVTTGNAVPKVIFDTDIAYVNDDAIALFMLTQADQAGMLKLLGVTTAGGNVFVPEATTAALRQLELIGRADIPVYQGTDEPLQGYRDMKEESRLYGIPYYCGAYWDFGTNDFRDLSRRSPDYLHLLETPMHGYAETPAQEEPAWDFIIRAVHAYPGEVTIMTVGAATNIALALQKDPTLADDAAGIIYMGGDIDCPGDATPAAELNWYYDPEAIRQCLKANWKSQLVVPDDLAQQIHLTPVIYERLAAANQNLITKLILENQRTFDMGESDYVWDVVVPAVFLKPELMVDVQERYITVDATPGINSGRAVSWPQHWLNNMETGEGFPEGVNRANILFSIDEDAFWDFYVDLLSYETSENKSVKTGIIGAMDEEVASLKEALAEVNIKTIAGMEFYEGKLDGNDVVVVKCSVGKVNAAACAQILISVFEVDRIINTGVAGSLDADIDIGDIVVSTEAVQHDMDVTVLGFARGEIPYSNQSVFPADEEMRKSAVQAVKETAPDIHVFEGRVCSGDQFIASREQKEFLISEFGGLCCEMEGAAIAQVCCMNGTPFVIIRAISDKADDSEEMSYVEFEKAAAERCAAVTRYMISH